MPADITREEFTALEQEVAGEKLVTCSYTGQFIKSVLVRGAASMRKKRVEAAE
jgi:hypothetical protein